MSQILTLIVQLLNVKATSFIMEWSVNSVIHLAQHAFKAETVIVSAVLMEIINLLLRLAPNAV